MKYGAIACYMFLCNGVFGKAKKANCKKEMLTEHV